jgi:hypothetical protein
MTEILLGKRHKMKQTKKLKTMICGRKHGLRELKYLKNLTRK